MSNKRRRFQFSLRALLIAALVLSVAFSWYAWRLRIARRQEAAVRVIHAMGGSTDDWVSPLEILGREHAPIVEADLPAHATEDDLVHLRHLPYLTVLGLSDTQITDAGLRHLTSLCRLRHLNIGNTDVTPAGVAELQRSLPNCEIDF